MSDVVLECGSGDGRQDPATDRGPLRAHHRLGPTLTRAPHHDGTAVLAHPHPPDGCRSTRKHPPPAANTVRTAQDSLLLTHQERSGIHWRCTHHHPNDGRDSQIDAKGKPQAVASPLIWWKRGSSRRLGGFAPSLLFHVGRAAMPHIAMVSITAIMRTIN